jgi:hypothetical protein
MVTVMIMRRGGYGDGGAALGPCDSGSGVEGRIINLCV